MMDAKKTLGEIVLKARLAQGLTQEEYAARFANPYDGEIAFVDTWITRLVDWLEETGRRDETLIIVAGDHGEGFHEHDEAEHGFFVYGSTMRVPLILSFPGRLTTPQTVPVPVALVDVFPTVVDLLGWESPPGLEGRSLAEACRTGSIDPVPVYGECEYPRMSFGWAGLRSLTTDRWKYIDAPRAELYDLRDDPGELNNILDTRKDIADKMRAALVDQVSRMSPDRYEARRTTLDAAAIAKLEALGYVAAPAAVADSTDNTALRDPKDMHPVFEAFTRALGMMNHDDFEKAAQILQRLSTESPESAEFHSVLGSTYLKLERYAEAQAAFEKRLEMAGPSPRPLCGLAEALQHQNRLQEAVVFYQQTIELSADWEPAHRELGTILSKMRQFPGAEIHWRRCVDLRPGHAHYLTNLGTVLLAQRRPSEAIPFLETALLDEPANEFAHRSLWQCYRAIGRRDDAVRALRAAKKALPGPSLIQCSLAWMLATAPAPSAEDTENAVRWAQECCEMLPVNVRHFDALAAAYAAQGEFEKAADVARQALAMAAKAGQLGVKGQIEARLGLYESGRPFVEGIAPRP
ncbi:MAG: sulfatase-like hydrolase/transferase [Planctomycetes bacterium]|nr:sulfatase-like hydrolase/transferase [Planctomycetota bacterium]